MQQSVSTSSSLIPSLLAERAHHFADSPAILALDGSCITYRDLHLGVQELASRLAEHGVAAGDAVALVLPNGPAMAVLFLAAATAGAAAPLNPAYQAAELVFYLDDLAARVLVIDADLDSPARAVAAKKGVPVLEVRAGPGAGSWSLHGDGDARPNAAAPDARGSDDVALILHTSGTTSRPKQVPLSHANLLASAVNVSRTLALTPVDRCLNVMPLFHIHGLVAAELASLHAGASVVCAPGFHAPSFFSWLETTSPTWYTAVPTMHQAILARAAEHASVIERARLRLIRSSSAALPRATLHELEQTFHVPVIEAYGMTEAAHQMASNPLPPLARKPGSVGRAAGPQLAVMGESGNLLPAGETGEVVIRGPNVTGGYAHNPDANLAAFRDGWFRTGDQGYLDGDGYLFLTGRLKEMINRGGEKIAPLEIDEALMAHPAVQQALTFGVRHSQLGEDVAAAVVLRAGASATERELREFVAARLAYFKIPRRVLFLPEIPKGPTGKLQRIGLADRLSLQEEEAAPVAPAVAPRTPLEEVLAAIWCQVLRTPAPGVHDDFFRAGGDSVTATQFVARVRDLLAVELPLLSFFDAPTVAAVATSVEKLLASETAALSQVPSRDG